MKNIIAIFGFSLFASLVLTSCGEANLKDLDDDIKDDADAVEAFLTIGEAQLDVLKSLKDPLEEIAVSHACTQCQQSYQ